MTISPCQYPGCDDGSGNPELTHDGMCRRCQHRYHRLIESLVFDWAVLRTTMPAPVRNEDAIRTARHREYGHPAEWASDLSAEIASKLNWTHDALADALHDNPPPHPGAHEVNRMRAAWRYVEPRIDALAKIDGAHDIAEELDCLYVKTKRGLGLTRPRIWLRGVPCMNCGTIALTLVNGENVECGECDATISQDVFGLLARHAIDAAIDAYDAANTPETTPQLA